MLLCVAEICVKELKGTRDTKPFNLCWLWCKYTFCHLAALMLFIIET